MSRDEIMYLQDIRFQTGMGCRCHPERSRGVYLKILREAVHYKYNINHTSPDSGHSIPVLLSR